MDSFSNCLIDVEGKDFEEEFKALHSEMDRPVKITGISSQKLIKYIVSTYDINSPFVGKYKSWGQRRWETAKYAGFPKKRGTNKYTDEAEKVIYGLNDGANQLILWYLVCMNNMDFMRLQAKEAAYFSQVKTSIDGGYGKPNEDNKLQSNIDSLAQEIKALQLLVFSGKEESERLSELLYNFAFTVSVDFRPEDRAERIQHGKPVVDEPAYGQYEPDVLRFIDDE